MASSSVTVNSVDTTTGANLTPALTTTSTDNNGDFSTAIVPQSGPVRITVNGGSYSSEMNGNTIGSPSEVTLLLSSGNSNAANLSVNPLSTFIDSRTVGLLAAGGTTFSTALSNATTQIENIYGLSSDPGTLTPVYDTTGTDAANLGLILGAIVNEDQYMCPATPGGLVTALASDIADGIFDGKGTSGSAVSYCGGDLPAIAGITDFQDALSGLNQLQNVTAGFAFGGTNNTLTTNNLADVALGGTEVYPTTPLNTINNAIPSAAPSAVNTFAPSGGPTMTSNRENQTATMLQNGQVLVAGGLVTGIHFGGNPTSSAELYNLAANTFTATTHTMTTARFGATATLLPSGEVLITGGVAAFEGTPLASAELYDPTSQKFTATTHSMTTGRAFQSATLLASGQVLIAGGVSALGQGGGPDGGALSSAEICDPTAGTFTATNNSMSSARSAATATLLPNGQVLIAGGDNNAEATNTANLYNPNTGKFSATGNMTAAREFAAAVLLPNGKVLITGGTTGVGSSAASSAELYDPAAGTFSATSNSMTSRRAYQTMTLLPNGKVLIAGGATISVPCVMGCGFPSSAVASAEVYDPAAGTFTATGSMTVARAWDIATLLSNGQVLVAGGQNGGGVPVNSTDLYTP